MKATAETSLRREPVVVADEGDRADVVSAVSGVEGHCLSSFPGPFRGLPCMREVGSPEETGMVPLAYFFLFCK